MRHTRDSLVQQRQELDERQHRVKVQSRIVICWMPNSHPVLIFTKNRGATWMPARNAACSSWTKPLKLLTQRSSTRMKLFAVDITNWKARWVSEEKKNTLSSHEPLYMLIHIYFLWQTEDGLLCRLMSLTHTETRSLLCKYFQKVIDLREGSKKMEQQFAELEVRRLIYYISSLFP